MTQLVAIPALIERLTKSDDAETMVMAAIAVGEWMLLTELLHAMSHIDPATLKEAYEVARTCTAHNSKNMH